MLENTFQHGGKQIKTRNLFFSRTPRPIVEIGDTIPLRHTQKGYTAFISNTAYVRASDGSEPIFQALPANSKALFADI